jgi:hypothetical protein
MVATKWLWEACGHPNGVKRVPIHCFPPQNCVYYGRSLTKDGVHIVIVHGMLASHQQDFQDVVLVLILFQ